MEHNYTNKQPEPEPQRRSTGNLRTGDDATNHDDAEGYYKVNIGERIAFLSVSPTEWWWWVRL